MESYLPSRFKAINTLRCVDSRVMRNPQCDSFLLQPRHPPISHSPYKTRRQASVLPPIDQGRKLAACRGARCCIIIRQGNCISVHSFFYSLDANDVNPPATRSVTPGERTHLHGASDRKQLPAYDFQQHDATATSPFKGIWTKLRHTTKATQPCRFGVRLKRELSWVFNLSQINLLPKLRWVGLLGSCSRLGARRWRAQNARIEPGTELLSRPQDTAASPPR